MQENAVTIQQKITDAIKILTKEDINLVGSGRTDAGVHALGQAANFRVENKLDIYRFRHSLNSILPLDISVTDMKIADEDFHARFDAKKRSYIYLISKIKSPFYNLYSWQYHEAIDILRLNELSRKLTGEFDFTSFARKNTETENKTCEVFQIHWRESKDILLFFIEADRFLHGMVRTIVGTILQACKNNEDEGFLFDIINSKDRQAAGEAVPAKGLFLYKVKY